MKYEPRTYRTKQRSPGLTSFNVVIEESDLYITAEKDLSKEATNILFELRCILKGHILQYPPFLDSLEPITPREDLHPFIRKMYITSYKAGVGPMASVAGAIAEEVGKRLSTYTNEVIVENGGDIYLNVRYPKIVEIFPGNTSPFKDTLRIKIKPEDIPAGICTSSGTVGHSLSFGRADSVTVLSSDTALSDAYATRIGNMIKSKDDVSAGIDFAKKSKDIRGILITIGDVLGIWGKVELI